MGIARIHKVRFYTLPGSMITGEYPLFSNSSLLAQTPIATYDCKVTADADQAITVPHFWGYETVSMVYVGAVGYYWVVGVHTSTSSNEAITFNLHYAAATSQIRKGQSIKGIWSRRPTPDPGIRQTLSGKPTFSGPMLRFPSLKAYLRKIDGSSGDQVKLYWVQISSTAYIDSSGVSHPDHYCRYGLFAVDNNMTAVWYEHLNYSVSDYRCYPTIDDIISNVDQYLGIESSTITDISVVPVCPYKYLTYNQGSSNPYIMLTDSSGSGYAPSIGKDVKITGVTSGSTITVYFRCYNLTPDYSIDTTDTIKPQEADQWKDYLWVTDCQLNIDTWDLRDWCGNIIAAITPFDEKTWFYLDYICDTTGIYTVVTNGSNSSHYIINSAKLPWVGSQWETYKAYSMDTDRKAIQFAQEQYDKQSQIEMISGIANGVIGAGIAGASGGVAGLAGGIISGVGSVATSAVSSALGRDLNNLKLSQDQQLTEARARASPGTAYATAYGKNQLKLMEMFEAGIYGNYPINAYTQSKWQEWIDEVGCPTEGVQTLEITAGYYKGRILSAVGVTGTLFNRLNEEFNSGIRFIDMDTWSDGDS